MNSREAKLRAKEILSGAAKNQLILITMLALLIPQIPTFILNATGISVSAQLVAVIVSLIVLIFERGFMYTVTQMYIEKKNGESFGISDFISNSFKNIKRSWAVSFSILPKMLIPILFYIVAGILGIVSMSSLEMLEKSGLILGMFNVVLYFVGMILMIRISYQYRYADIEAINSPDLTAKEVVKKTGTVMDGNRMRAFKLDLSFFLWVIVVSFIGGLISGLIPFIGILILALTVAFILVNLMMAHIVLYEDIVNSSTDAIPNYMNEVDTQSDSIN